MKGKDNVNLQNIFTLIKEIIIIDFQKPWFLFIKFVLQRKNENDYNHYCLCRFKTVNNGDNSPIFLNNIVFSGEK